jgi:hypothetical protein
VLQLRTWARGKPHLHVSSQLVSSAARHAAKCCMQAPRYRPGTETIAWARKSRLTSATVLDTAGEHYCCLVMAMDGWVQSHPARKPTTHVRGPVRRVLCHAAGPEASPNIIGEVRVRQRVVVRCLLAGHFLLQTNPSL